MLKSQDENHPLMEVIYFPDLLLNFEYLAFSVLSQFGHQWALGFEL